MRTRRAVSGLIVLCALFVFGVQAFAHEGHEHKVMGTVTMVGPDHVMLKDKDGKTVTVYLKPDTKVVHGKMAMKVADIKAAMRVVIDTVMEKEKGREKVFAKSIALGAAPAAK